MMTSISRQNSEGAQMITSLGKHALATATAVALGGLNTIAAQTPAHATGFSATYTCTIPGLGSRSVVLDGWLTSSGQTAVNRPTGFQLQISSLGLSSPVALDSWSASAWIDVSGAESTSFRVTGSGGFVPAQQPISGNLIGDWAPTVGGTDLLSVNSITISANNAVTGNVTAQCAPNEPRPVAETLTVFSPYYSGWDGPIAPPYNPGWNRPVAPPYHHGHGWDRPVAPPHHHGWNRPIAPPHHGGWNRPVTPPHRPQGGRQHSGAE
jgi:hypothetical protein